MIFEKSSNFFFFKVSQMVFMINNIEFFKVGIIFYIKEGRRDYY